VAVRNCHPPTPVQTKTHKESRKEGKQESRQYNAVALLFFLLSFLPVFLRLLDRLNLQFAISSQPRLLLYGTRGRDSIGPASWADPLAKLANPSRPRVLALPSNLLLYTNVY
jgi:hypothetical protein